MCIENASARLKYNQLLAAIIVIKGFGNAIKPWVKLIVFIIKL